MFDYPFISLTRTKPALRLTILQVIKINPKINVDHHPKIKSPVLLQANLFVYLLLIAISRSAYQGRVVYQIVMVISNKKNKHWIELTIASAIITRESFKVCGFEPRVIIEESTHHAGPWAGKHQEAFSRTFDDTSVVIQQDWLHAEERECLEIDTRLLLGCFSPKQFTVSNK